ncbi:macrolide transporter subunit MacA [compost metagenome]
MNSSNTSSTTSSEVVSVEVGTQDIQNTISSSGEVASSAVEKIYLTSGKYFSQLCVETDDTVKEGENILQYSNGTYLTAPYDCVISTYLLPSTGSICTSSNYVELKNIDTLNMTLSIDESEISKVNVGQEVEIKLNAFEDKSFKGTISKIDSVGTYSTSGTSFSATVEFENDGNVKIGMSGTSSIIIANEKGVVAVPISAIQTNENQKYVVVVKDDGTTENVNVETGISNSSYVQILSGLKTGQKIQMVQISTKNNNRQFNRENITSGGGMEVFGQGTQNGNAGTRSSYTGTSSKSN